MDIIVHKPVDEENEKNIEMLVAKLHADTIRGYLNKMPCSKGKKIEILKKIEKDL